MSDSYKIIGTSKSGRHYDVGVYRSDPPPSGPERPLTLALNEGLGHGCQGSCFTLADMLDERWTEHLQLCNCLWLRDLAREEQASGRFFSADEIWERWQARLPGSSR